MIPRILQRQTERKTIIYTTHKAGSMVLHGVLREICQKNRIPYYTPNTSGLKKFPYERVLDGDDVIARKRKGCFGALRFYVPTAMLPDANVVVHLRDPRDVLTSMFYSYCFMHPARYPGEIPPNTGYRKEVADAGIDDFVLQMTDSRFSHFKGDYGTGCNFGPRIGNLKTRYETYLDRVLSIDGVTLLSYEQMVLDFRSWLKNLISVFALNAPSLTEEHILEQYAGSFAPSIDEDVTSHKRKVTPGDHLTKLAPDTILELNRRLDNILKRLGYLGEQFKSTSIPKPEEPHVVAVAED